MTAEQFRRVALTLPGTAESAHMRHPDFRVSGKIFATLGYPNDDYGMVKLSPGQQERFTQAAPSAFTPVKGAWGRQGCTSVCLKAAKVALLRKAMSAAWRNAAPKRMAEQLGSQK
jgi:hypothetical protein